MITHKRTLQWTECSRIANGLNTTDSWESVTCKQCLQHAPVEYKIKISRKKKENQEPDLFTVHEGFFDSFVEKV